MQTYKIIFSQQKVGFISRKQRVQTKVETFIPLNPVAEQILMLYNTTDNSKLVFPLPVRDMIWHNINQIGVSLGLKENLSYHQRRHRIQYFNL
jgi:hypothetical protein